MNNYITLGNSYLSTGTGAPAGTKTSTNAADAQKSAAAANWPSVGGYSQPFAAVASPTGGPFYDLKASGGGVVNIVKDFKWTKSNFRDEVPRLQLKEIKITGLQQLNYYMNMAAKVANSATSNLFGDNSLTDYLEGLYSKEDTGFSYVFPYYAQSSVTSSNSWSEKIPVDADYLSGMSNMASGAATAAAVLAPLFGPKGRAAAVGIKTAIKAGSSAAKIAKSAAQASVMAYGSAKGSPYAGIEQPMYFSGSTKKSYTISFPLFNTDSLVEIRRNYDFIRLFQYQNLLTRTSIATYTPPVIYKSEPADGHTSPIGMRFFYVSDFTVNNLGAIRSIDLKNGNSLKIAIPEAYQVNITISDMLANSRNLFSSTMSNNGESVVRTIQTAQTTGDRLFNIG